MTRTALLGKVALLGAWGVFAIYALWGVPGVPFHPDEATHLYMSHDFDLLFRQFDPAAVTWGAPSQARDVINYRLLDTPLTYYLPGLGRLLAGFSPGLPHDWDWSATWTSNAALGTLPAPGLLDAGRWPAAALTVLSLLPVYAIGVRLGSAVPGSNLPGGEWLAVAAGLVAAALYGFSGLLLLHGRRANAEGPLLFFTLATVWALLRWPRQPILAAGLTALAVACKLTGLALLPVAGVVILLQKTTAAGGGARWRERLTGLILYGVSFLAFSWLLTPALWSQPLAGLAAMVQARQQLLAGQVGGLSAAAPVQVVNTPGQRLFAMLYHVYFAPPAFWDIPNYAAQTRASELAYLSVPLQAGWHTTSLANNLAAGGAMLALSLAGIGFGLHDLIGHRLAGDAAGAPSINALVVLVVWSAATIGVLLPISIAWQRYYLPLVPIVCLWAAYGLVSILLPFVRAAARARPEMPVRPA